MGGEFHNSRPNPCETAQLRKRVKTPPQQRRKKEAAPLFEGVGLLLTAEAGMT